MGLDADRLQILSSKKGVQLINLRAGQTRVKVISTGCETISVYIGCYMAAKEYVWISMIVTK